MREIKDYMKEVLERSAKMGSNNKNVKTCGDAFKFSDHEVDADKIPFKIKKNEEKEEL